MTTKEEDTPAEAGASSSEFDAMVREVERQADSSGNISLHGLYRILNSFSSRMTHRGHSYSEIEAMRELTPEDWANARRKYKWTLLTSFVAHPATIVVLLAIGSALLTYTEYKIAGVVVLMFAAYRAGGRSGHRAGYDEGFVMGHDAGINRALGLSDKEAAEIGKANDEMELDRTILEHLDREEAKRGGGA